MSTFLNNLLFLRKPYLGLTNILSTMRQYMYILNKTPMILNAPIQETVPLEPRIVDTSVKNIETMPVDLNTTNDISTMVPEPQKKVDEYITPKLTDSLFWCVYIATNGYDEYLQIQRNYGMKELEIKKSIADMVKEKPSAFKLTNHKVTKVSIQEILSELLTSQKETSMLCLMAMTIYYNINVILVNSTNQFMVEFFSNKDVELPTYAIRKDDRKYSINVEPLSKERIANMKETMVCLENYLKPLKPMTTYKVDDLIQLATKLGLYKDTEKIKKIDLYEKLSEYMKWK